MKLLEYPMRHVQLKYFFDIELDKKNQFMFNKKSKSDINDFFL